MGMTRSWGVVVGVVVVTVAACSSDDNGGGGGGTGIGGGSGGSNGDAAGLGVGARPGETESREAFLAALGGAICAMFEPCCTSAGKTYKGQACEDYRAKVESAFHPGPIDAAKAQACLDAVRAGAADPTRCGTKAFDEATFEALCNKAYLPDPESLANAGKACKTREDCGKLFGGGDCQLGICRSLPDTDQVGATPCLLQKDADPPQGTIYRCDPTAGIYCNQATSVCDAFVAPGQPCAVGIACGPSGMCIGGTCQKKPVEGEACLNAIKGAGGFCADGFQCNKESLLCEARPAIDDGLECNSPADCKSGNCDLGSQSCKPYDFTKYLNCNGGK